MAQSHSNRRDHRKSLAESIGKSICICKNCHWLTSNFSNSSSSNSWSTQDPNADWTCLMISLLFARWLHSYWKYGSFKTLSCTYFPKRKYREQQSLLDWDWIRTKREWRVSLVTNQSLEDPWWSIPRWFTILCVKCLSCDSRSLKIWDDSFPSSPPSLSFLPASIPPPVDMALFTRCDSFGEIWTWGTMITLSLPQQPSDCL